MDIDIACNAIASPMSEMVCLQLSMRLLLRVGGRCSHRQSGPWRRPGELEPGGPVGTTVGQNRRAAVGDDAAAHEGRRCYVEQYLIGGLL